MRTLARWSEAALVLASFGGLSLWAVFSMYGSAFDSWAAADLKNVGGAPLAARPLVEGAFLGRIEIPRLDVSAALLEGVSAATLRVAAGHIPGTGLPGGGGNTAIAAHRDSFFRRLSAIQPGDRILVITTMGVHPYRVSYTEIVRPRDTRVLNPTGIETLTLVTCYPFHYIGHAPKRFIVHAEADLSPLKANRRGTLEFQTRPGGQ